jgi:DNA polymerase II large subunit
VGFGEFLENNHPLVPSGYCEEWWSHDLEGVCTNLSRAQINERLEGSDITPDNLESFIDSPLLHIPTGEQAVHISKNFQTPLHPRYLYRWLALKTDEAADLRRWLLKKHKFKKKPGINQITLPYNSKYKAFLERVGIPHTLTQARKYIQLNTNPATIYAQLGDARKSGSGANALELMNSCSEVVLRDKIGFCIGARMGRPEKAEERKMHPPVQVIFPVGRTIASERRIERVAEAIQYVSTLDTFDLDHGVEDELPKSQGVMLELVSRICLKCRLETFESKCPQCGAHTEQLRWCSKEGCGQIIEEDKCPNSHDVNLIRTTKEVPVDLKNLLERVKTELDEPQAYGVRGVLGLTSEHKIPEYLGKGVLRAKHGVYCYRDGTARFDATDAPLTHFKPSEIGVSIQRLHDLGYLNDYKGKPLVSDEQVVELKVQDLVVPENCADYLVRVGMFVDDCLEKIYGLNRYYNFKSIEDVVGQLVVGLAPHTSAGIIGRIVGFTNASICYAHPYWHAAKRRNCDGDEDALILVLDALINFSKHYLPAGRGGFMDAPLVLSIILNPSEVDDEAHNVEVCNRYPAQFYDMVSEATHPKTVESLVDIIANRLNTEAQYEGFGFTHGTMSIDKGPRNSRYKTLDSMVEKLEAQLNLARLIDAVDSKDVAQRVLSHHFIRDIRGNLRAYSTQKTRCIKCNRIYRRIPLSGNCVCGNKLSLTVKQRNISKYLEIAEKMIRDHALDEYQQQRLRLINSALDSLFISEQTSLTEFF